MIYKGEKPLLSPSLPHIRPKSSTATSVTKN